MRNLILILFLFFSINIYSQYNNVKLYFNDSTAIEGLGYIKKHKIYFKVEEKDEFSEWDLGSVYRIDFFGFENKVRTFEYIYTDKYRDFKLLENVLEGEVKLYKLEEVNIIYFGNGPNKTISESTSLEYFVKHQNDKTAIDIMFGFKKKIAQFFSDCPDIIEMVNDKTFKKDDIELIVNYYNKNCSTKS